MDKFTFAEGLGETIIKSQHDYFAAGHSDDLNHITNLKRIIVAISEYLKSEGLPENGINTLIDNLRQLCKDPFIDSCLANRDEDEDKQEVKEDSEIYFDYIYEHEEYPE